MKGCKEIMEAILRNPSVNIHVTDEETGVNSFWLAAFYGHGQILKVLASKGIDILNKHKVTQSNALHVAAERNHVKVVK